MVGILKRDFPQIRLGCNLIQPITLAKCRHYRKVCGHFSDYALESIERISGGRDRHADGGGAIRSTRRTADPGAIIVRQPHYFDRPHDCHDVFHDDPPAIAARQAAGEVD